MIYESNSLEGEGLSRGETKKLAEEYFPHLPSNYDAIKLIMRVGKDPFDILCDQESLKRISEICEKHDNVIPTVSYRNKSKGFIEVYQHYVSYLMSQRKSLTYLLKCYETVLTAYVYYSFKKQHSRPPTPEEVATIMDMPKNLDRVHPYDKNTIAQIIKHLDLPTEHISLFSEVGIKGLHEKLADGLLDKTAKVAAGEYRIDNRIVGDLDLTFPAPELIPKCMEQFLKNANSLVNSLWTNPENIFNVAAKVSHEFVRIHPFPDFNGRLSRLIMTVILNPTTSLTKGQSFFFCETGMIDDF